MIAASARRRQRRFGSAGRAVAAAALAGTALTLVGNGVAAATPGSVPTFWSNDSAISIGNLLLPAATLETLTGADRPMAVAAMTTTMVDTAKRLDPASCAGAFSPTEKRAYDNSGYTDMTTQLVVDGTPKDADHTVTQGVVRFPTPQQASAYFASAQQSWAACADRTVIRTSRSGTPQPWQLGPVVTDPSGTLLAIGQNSPTAGRCEHALTVAGSVVIDITACGQQVDPAGQGSAIATTIATEHPLGG